MKPCWYTIVYHRATIEHSQYTEFVYHSKILHTTTCDYHVYNHSLLHRKKTSIGSVSPRSSFVQAKWPTLRSSARTGSTLAECSSRNTFEAGCSGRSLSPCGRPPYAYKPMPGDCWPGGGWGWLNLCLLDLFCTGDPLQDII